MSLPVKNFVTSVKNFSADLPIALVTGGNFISSFLCEVLLSQGCQVICIDGSPEKYQKNFSACAANPTFFLVKHDILSPTLGFPRLDYVFHLLAFNDDWLESEKEKFFDRLRLITEGTKNLLELCEKNNAKFLFGSTLDIFHSFSENDSGSKLFKNKYALQYRVKNIPEAMHLAELLTTDYYQREGVNARVVRTDDFYGPRMSFGKKDLITQLLKGVLTEGIIRVPEQRLAKMHPTYVSDIVYGLVKSMLSPGTAGEVISLINSQEVNCSDFSKELENRLGEEAAVGFTALPKIESKIYEKLDEGQDKINWICRVDWKEGIRQWASYFAKDETPRSPKMGEPRPRKKLLSKLAGFIFFLSAIFFIVSIPMWSVFIEGYLGFVAIKRARVDFLSGDLKKAAREAQAAASNFLLAQKTVSFFAPVYRLVTSEKRILSEEGIFKMGYEISVGFSRLGKIEEQADRLAGVVFRGQAGSVADISSAIRQELDLSYYQLGLAEAGFKNQEWWPANFFGFGTDQMQSFLLQLSEARDLLFEARETVRLFPALFGLYKKQTYLVLLQNNMELRPTGGFIGSYAILTFEGGRFLDISVEDVYSADGQLRGHVEPPADLKKYLGEAGWYLRDSNWDPHYPTSAARAAWFLEKEIGRSVDGVFAVDINFAAKLLSAIGEVSLPDYQLQINSRNLFEKIEYQTETNFFPGSTQKKDILGSLARIIFLELQKSNREKTLQISKAFYESLGEKDLLIYLKNQEAMNIISSLGWDGSIKEGKCFQSACISDYFFLVESNVGVNKANYFVKRDIEQAIAITDGGLIRRAVMIKYFNESPAEILPGGAYRNYLRLLIPVQAKLEGITIDGKDLSSKNIEEYILHGKRVIGFLVEVPVSQGKEMIISYTVGRAPPGEENFYYSLYVQKQPGTALGKVKFDFPLPFGWKAVFGPKKEAVGEGQSLDVVINKDTILEGVFRRSH